MSILIDDGNTKEDKIVKCDIGEFVVSYQKVKKLLSPVVDVVIYSRNILKWEKPLQTVFWSALSLGLTWHNPVYLLISCLLPIPPLLIMELVRGIGKRKYPEKHYQDYFRKKGELQEQLERQAALEKWRQRLDIYLQILIEFQRHFRKVLNTIEYIKSIITWKRPRLSLLMLLLSLSLELLLYNFEFRLVLCLVIGMVFFANIYFFLAIKSMFMKIVSCVKFSKRRVDVSQIERKEEQSVVPQQSPDEEVENIEYYDAELSFESTTDTEDDMLDAKKTTTQSSKTENGRSFVRYLPQSLRRRAVGTCSKCDQPCSTLLTRRRYCRHCGKSFCARCCNTRVPRALLGATAPAAYQEKVLVCITCNVFLNNRMKTTATELVA